jgi:hypothetical protein
MLKTPIKIAGRTLTIHPAADEFPMLEGRAYDDFRDDVKAHGQREKIELLGNQVIDGRNRLRALMDLKIEPQFVQYKGTDPVGEVISRNINRRHLTDDQRVAIVAKLRAPEITADAAKNKTAIVAGKRAPAKGEASKRLAKEAKVSGSKGRTALETAKHAPGALEEVIAGKTKLAVANKKAKAAKAEKEKAAGKVKKPKPVASLKDRVEKKFMNFMQSFTVQEYPKVRELVRNIVATADKKGHAAAFAGVKE